MFELDFDFVPFERLRLITVYIRTAYIAYKQNT